jgi:hypothetical protein
VLLQLRLLSFGALKSFCFYHVIFYQIKTYIACRHQIDFVLATRALNEPWKFDFERLSGVLLDLTHLRGNKFKLVKPKSVSVRDSNFYVNRIVNIWNSLPDSIVTAASIFSFKRRLNSFDFSNFIIL